MKRGDIVKKRGMKIGYLSQHFDLKNNNTIFEEMMEIFSHLKEIKKEYSQKRELGRLEMLLVLGKITESEKLKRIEIQQALS